MARRLAEAEIFTAEDLRTVGAVEAYARLRFRFGREISLNALWAMDAALSGIDWRQLSADRKAALKEMLAARTNAPRARGRGLAAD